MILARIFWVYASLALLPSSAFPLYRSPNVSSKARGTPRAQTQRTGVILRHHLFLTHAFIATQRKVRRTPTAVSPTAAVCSTYLRDRQEPDRVAPWLLRTSSRGTRLASRRSAKSCSSEARPAWTGDPAEQRSHRSRRRVKEEDQAERWRSSSSSSEHSCSNRSRRRSCYRRSNCGNTCGRGICGSHVRGSGRCDAASDTRVEQRRFAEPVGGIGRTVCFCYGGNYSPYWRAATAGTNTEEEESYNRSGQWCGRRCGDWWGWRHGQEAWTAARRPATCRRGECVSLRVPGVRVDGLYFGVVTYYCQFSLLYNFASYDIV
jgi:hypothetical protein